MDVVFLFQFNMYIEYPWKNWIYFFCTELVLKPCDLLTVYIQYTTVTACHESASLWNKIVPIWVLISTFRKYINFSVHSVY